MSGFILAYLTRIIFPLISQYVLELRVIDVYLNNLEFHSDGHRFTGTALVSPRFAAPPDDAAAGHPDADIVRDDAALYARLKEQLFDANFDVVIPSLQREAGAIVKVSWTAVSASCAQVFYWLYELARDSEIIERQAMAFFGDPSSPMDGEVKMESVEHQGKTGYFARRAGCCLFWRVKDEDVYCFGCILLSEE